MIIASLVSSSCALRKLIVGTPRLPAACVTQLLTGLPALTSLSFLALTYAPDDSVGFGSPTCIDEQHTMEALADAMRLNVSLLELTVAGNSQSCAPLFRALAANSTLTSLTVTVPPYDGGSLVLASRCASLKSLALRGSCCDSTRDVNIDDVEFAVELAALACERSVGWLPSFGQTSFVAIPASLPTPVERSGDYGNLPIWNNSEYGSLPIGPSDASGIRPVGQSAVDPGLPISPLASALPSVPICPASALASAPGPVLPIYAPFRAHKRLWWRKEFQTANRGAPVPPVLANLWQLSDGLIELVRTSGTTLRRLSIEHPRFYELALAHLRKMTGNPSLVRLGDDIGASVRVAEHRFMLVMNLRLANAMRGPSRGLTIVGHRKWKLLDGVHIWTTFVRPSLAQVALGLCCADLPTLVILSIFAEIDVSELEVRNFDALMWDVVKMVRTAFVNKQY